jgi:hypothetical protein
MKIYVVTKGVYSDYGIITATLDRERAEKIAKRYSDQWYEAEVEVYEDCEESTNPVWEVVFNSRGDVTSVAIDPSTFAFHSVNEVRNIPDERTMVYVFSNTPEGAIKIAAEKRAMCLAEQQGIV